VDRVVDHYPEQCENCWCNLAHTPDADPQRCQVTELPPVKPETTEHRAHAVTCGCGYTTRAVVPESVTASSFGPRLSSIIAMLTGVFHLSRRQAVMAAADFFGVDISLGAVSAMEDRVSEAIEPAVDEAWNEARRADVKHTDGTGWCQAGRALQLWTIATTAVTVFKVLTEATTDALKTLLGRIKGVMVSDRATALDFWAMKRRQICWAQLRSFVLWRRRSFGTQSERGNRFAERIMTVAHTARKQGKPILACLTAACQADVLGQPCPSLLAA